MMSVLVKMIRGRSSAMLRVFLLEAYNLAYHGLLRQRPTLDPWNRTMDRFRFTIMTFLIVTTLFAIGMVAIVSQSRTATSAAYTLFVMLICLGLAGAVIPTARSRPFWIGFAIFGWMYWFVEFDAGPAGPNPAGIVPISRSWLGPASVPASDSSTGLLLTGELMEWLESNLIDYHSPGTKVMAQWRGGSYYAGTVKKVDRGNNQYLIDWDDGSAAQWTPASGVLPNSPHLRIAAHSTFGGLFAVLGGTLAAVFFGPRKEGRTASRPW